MACYMPFYDAATIHIIAVVTLYGVVMGREVLYYVMRAT